jgi:hypothetical protein
VKKKGIGRAPVLFSEFHYTCKGILIVKLRFFLLSLFLLYPLTIVFSVVAQENLNTHILYAIVANADNYSLNKFSFPGGEAETVANLGQVSCLSLSPDFRHAVYFRGFDPLSGWGDGNGEIINLETGEISLFFEDVYASCPVWSNNSQTIAYLKDDDLYTYTVETGEEQLVLETLQVQDPKGNIHWSYDDSKIFISAIRINLDLTKTLLVITLADSQVDVIADSLSFGSQPASMTVSAAYPYLIYKRSIIENQNLNQLETSINFYNFETSESRVLFEATEAFSRPSLFFGDWAEDGKRVLIAVVDVNNASEIHIFNAQTGEIESFETNYRSLAWLAGDRFVDLGGRYYDSAISDFSAPILDLFEDYPYYGSSQTFTAYHMSPNAEYVATEFTNMFIISDLATKEILWQEQALFQVGEEPAIRPIDIYFIGLHDWSPDSRYFAFFHEHYDTSRQSIVVVDIDTAEVYEMNVHGLANMFFWDINAG